MNLEPHGSPSRLSVPAQFAAKQNSAKTAHLRSTFLISDPDDPDAPTRLSALIGGGGRGGGTRLGLLLTLLWVMTAAPYTTNRGPSWWADALGRPGPNGVRAVQTNLRELEKRGFVKLSRSGAGKAVRIELLNEITGAPYQRPYDTADRYIRVPATLWTTNAVAKLSSAGISMYLILLYYYRGVPTETWFSPAEFRRRHKLADSTRTKGLNELVAAGIIHVSEQYVDTDTVDGFVSVPRRLYRINDVYLPPKSRPSNSPSPGTAPQELHNPLAADPWGLAPWAQDPFANPSQV